MELAVTHHWRGYEQCKWHDTLLDAKSIHVGCSDC